VHGESGLNIQWIHF